MYAFSIFDPSLANGFSGTECDLDSDPYDPLLEQCNYVTAFYVAVNKVPDPDAWEMQLSRRASTQYLQEKRPHDGKAKSLWFLP